MPAPAPRLVYPARAWVGRALGPVAIPAIAVIVGLVAYLGPEWLANPDLSHGLFAPVVFGLLLWEGARQGPTRWVPAGGLGLATLAVLLVATLAMAAVGCLLAASVGWTHAVVRFALSSAAAGLLLSALLILASEKVRAIPLNWTTFTAVALWILAAPLPTGTGASLTLTLQSWVTVGVLESLLVLGIPARQIGNLIELATTTVGVEEACSGIRSLVSCLYAGLFFSAWLLRSSGARFALVLLAPLLAIAMNFVRSLGLTLLANAGVEIMGFWHDASGFAILGVTAAILAGLASALGPSVQPPAIPTAPALESAAGGGPLVPLFSGACAALAIGALTVALLSRPNGEAREPALTTVESLLPAESVGWAVRTNEDLYRFSGVLQTNFLAERTYLRMTDAGPLQINAYVAHWSAGAAPVSLVASHTPDACWPGAGWSTEPNEQHQADLTAGERVLPRAEQRIFRFGGQPQYVWFWHVYDGRVINYQNPYSIPALLAIALEYGFRREGSQYFVRLSSNRPWTEVRDEPLVHELAANLSRIGLKP